MRTPGIYIKGLGVCLPPAVPTDLHGFTSVTIGDDTSAPELALRAAQEAFKRCGEQPQDISLLLYTGTWHQGPDGWQPQYYLQRYLVGDEVLALQIQHGRNGVFSALELAAAHVTAGTGRSDALVVAADNFGTPLVDRWTAGSGHVLGDAAGAVVLTKEPGFAALLSVGSLTLPEGEELDRAGQPLFPPGVTVGRDVDFSARTAASQERPGLGADVDRALVDCVAGTLDEAGISLDDIKRVAVTHEDRTVVEGRLNALGVPLSTSTWEFGRTVGQLGASDQIVAFDHLLTTGGLAPGDHLLLIGETAGITLSSAVIRIEARPFWLE